jgi:hypothetical protein
MVPGRRARGGSGPIALAPRVCRLLQAWRDVTFIEQSITKAMGVPEERL